MEGSHDREWNVDPLDAAVVAAILTAAEERRSDPLLTDPDFKCERRDEPQAIGA